MSHTPGPWVTDTSHSYEWEGITIWADDVVIAHVVDDQHDNKEANANLIAAAPELLDTLKELYMGAGASITYHDKTLSSRINAAIAKAEGRK